MISTGWESLLPSPTLVSFTFLHMSTIPQLCVRGERLKWLCTQPGKWLISFKEQLQAQLVYYAYYHNGSVGADEDIDAAILRLSVLILSDKSFTVSVKDMFDQVQYCEQVLGSQDFNHEYCLEYLFIFLLYLRDSIKVQYWEHFCLVFLFGFT